MVYNPVGDFFRNAKLIKGAKRRKKREEAYKGVEFSGQPGGTGGFIPLDPISRTPQMSASDPRNTKKLRSRVAQAVEDRRKQDVLFGKKR